MAPVKNVHHSFSSAHSGTIDDALAHMFCRLNIVMRSANLFWATIPGVFPVLLPAGSITKTTSPSIGLYVALPHSSLLPNSFVVCEATLARLGNVQKAYIYSHMI